MAYEYVIWGVPPKGEAESLLRTINRDGVAITEQSEAESLMLWLVSAKGCTACRIQQFDPMACPSELWASIRHNGRYYRLRESI